MSTFAQVINSVAHNICEGATKDEAKAKSFAPGYNGGYPGVDWEQVPDGTKCNATRDAQGNWTQPSAPVPENRVRGLSLDEFRKLFTDAEQEVIDSYDMTGCAVVLNDAQKIKMRNFMKKAEARGAVNAIDVTTNGMSAGLDFLTARGFIAAGRKAEIVAGITKS